MKHKYYLHFFSWVAIFTLAWVDDVYAYLDPGVSSMLFQSLVAAIAGGVFIIKAYWGRLKKTFRSKKGAVSKRSESDSNWS